MPVIPFSSDSPSAQPQPSEASLLMALAEMHKQGRVSRPPSGESVPSTKAKPKAAKGPL